MKLFEFRQRLFRVHTREDGVSLVDRHGLGEFAPYVRGIPDLNVSACPDLREDLLAGRGDERQQQRCADADRLEKIVHDACQACLVRFVFCKRPRHRLVNILVGPLDALEDLLERVLELELFHLRLDPVTQAGDERNQALVKLACGALRRKRAAEVFFNHRRRAGNEISEVVCKVNVDGIDEQLIGEVAVRAERERAQQEKAQRVYAEHLGKHIGVNNVALGF